MAAVGANDARELQPLPLAAAVESDLVVSPLSGIEQYCLFERGLVPGTFLLGNHVVSMGWLGNIGSFLTTLAGGSNTLDTNFMADARHVACRRLEEEALKRKMDGVVGIAAQIVHHGGNVLEFLVTGGGVRWGHLGSRQFDFFTAACSGEQLGCLLDCGFVPLRMVFGTESYSRGIGGAILGGLRTVFVSGEIPEYSETFMMARQRALQRLREEAFALGANFVSGVKLSALNFSMLQEVSFCGTACKHPDLPPPRSAEEVSTSGLGEQELWSLCSHGYLPMSVVLAVSIYNMGMGGSVVTFFQNIGGGELNRFTDLVTSGRRVIVERLHEQAAKLGANKVLGMQTEVENFAGSGCIEFFAFGTAVSRTTIRPQSAQLSPQYFNQERAVFTSTKSLDLERKTNQSTNID